MKLVNFFYFEKYRALKIYNGMLIQERLKINFTFFIGKLPILSC